MRLLCGLMGLWIVFPIGVGVADDPAASNPEAAMESATAADAPSTTTPAESPLATTYEFWSEEAGKPTPAKELCLRDDFDGKLALPWNIMRIAPDHFSLSEHEGHLTVTTQLGNIHRVQDEHPARNLFLLANPLGVGDFCMTIKVSHFDPTIFHQQLALLCYDDDDNYLKWSYEKSWVPRKDIGFVLIRETNMESTHALSYQAKLKAFWLRVTKRGNSFECAFSADVEDYKIVGTRPWGSGSPKYLGFVAKNGGNREAGNIEARIDWFELRSLGTAPVFRKNPWLGTPSVAIDPASVPASYHGDFRSKGFDEDVLLPVGYRSPYGLTFYRRETNGLRITIPADQGPFKQYVGVSPSLKISGDFEITASYDLFSAERPTGPEGAGANLYIMTRGAGNGAMLRRCTAPDGVQAYMVYEFVRRSGYINPKAIEFYPARGSRGKLQFVRIGDRLEYRVSDGSSDAFRTIHTVEFGDDDVRMTRMENATAGEAVYVRVRWQGLRIRAAELTPIEIPLLDDRPKE